MKYFSFLFGLGIVAIIFYAAHYFYNQTYEQTMTEIQNNPSLLIPTAPPRISATTSAEVASSSAIPADWKTILSSSYNYSIRIPRFIQNESSSDGDKFYFLGPNQSLGTEMSDGISVLIKAERLNGKTLQVIAKEQQALSAKAETTESVTAVKAAEYGELKGFQYTTTALGTFNSIYIPQSAETYLKIISIVEIPEVGSSSYQDTVNKIIASISF